MVAQNTVRSYGVNQVFRFVEGILLHRKSSQILIFFSLKRPILRHMCATRSQLPYYISTMDHFFCLQINIYCGCWIKFRIRVMLLDPNLLNL